MKTTIKIILSILLGLALGALTIFGVSKIKFSEPQSVQQTYNMPVDSIGITTMQHLSASNLYVIKCKMCHDNDGKGDGIKARVDTTLCPYDLSKTTKRDKEIYYVIYNGIGRMPNHHKLSDSSTQLIVVYIKKFKK